MGRLFKAVRLRRTAVYLFVPFSKRVANRAPPAADGNQFCFSDRKHKRIRNSFPDRFAPLPPLYCAEFACFRVTLFPLAIRGQGGGNYNAATKRLNLAGEQAHKRQGQNHAGSNVQPFPFHFIHPFHTPIC